MNSQQSSPHKKIIAGAAAGVIALGLVVAVIFYQLDSRSQKTQNTTSSNSTTSDTASPSTTSSSYKDGTYSASSSYSVPHGSESIKVTVTVKGGVVTDSQLVNSENDPESAQFQEAFANEYKSSVVGKKIDAISVAYVSGASDTTQGFNDALQAIITQARA